MELTYSNQLEGFDPEKRYRNPEHFDKPEAGVTSVVVIGDWPKVTVAYEHVGIEVTLQEPQARQPVSDKKTELEEQIGKLQIESDMVRAVIDGLDAGEIEKPDAGELAIRLFHSLDSIRVKMLELVGARDVLAAENETLRNKLAELKPDEGVEVEALKAKLEAAGVSYRANASKESLEKLIADLPKT